ncbi:putative kinase Y4mE [Methylophaga thalassica]|uniref:Kinase Y4mE n=1 Tax=Methylophaga thalassica TaxID=40223 RepID=A0ABQ5TVR0_9GAMM|nr:type II toxin-antitoxin system HipA family toxin [Methylophaga thalassica]GLQ00094.1 putative kinase Y4mE [Methylophaga thalassica]
MTHGLAVYLNNKHVGRLWLADKRRLAFQYEKGWLRSEDTIPLSLSLPLQPDIFDDDVARPFFANLLPEAEQRRLVALNLGVSEGNDYALLDEIGGECAGAVMLLPDGELPTEYGIYQPVDDDELKAIIDELPRRPMMAGEEGVRLSLAGAQSKLPVYYNKESGLLSITSGAAPSTHIIKPPISRIQHSVENEAFCMQLALHLGLAVPPATVLHKHMPLYLVERYDRSVDGASGRIERLHQEDFCQALAVMPDMKYEKEGGPILQQCFQLLRDRSIQPTADIQSLLDWVVFNFLIGNADAHAKNISLLLTDTGPKLAPFYDLLSTAVYPELNAKMAMRIGGEDRPDWIIARRWQQFAKDIEIQDKLVRSRLQKMSQQIVEQAYALRDAFFAEHGQCVVIDKIITIIEARARKVATILAETK